MTNESNLMGRFPLSSTVKVLMSNFVQPYHHVITIVMAPNADKVDQFIGIFSVTSRIGLVGIMVPTDHDIPFSRTFLCSFKHPFAKNDQEWTFQIRHTETI